MSLNVAGSYTWKQARTHVLRHVWWLSVITGKGLVTLSCWIFSLENCRKKEADGSMGSNLWFIQAAGIFARLLFQVWWESYEEVYVLFKLHMTWILTCDNAYVYCGLELKPTRCFLKVWIQMLTLNPQVIISAKKGVLIVLCTRT